MQTARLQRRHNKLISVINTVSTKSADTNVKWPVKLCISQTFDLLAYLQSAISCLKFSKDLRLKEKWDLRFG